MGSQSLAERRPITKVPTAQRVTAEETQVSNAPVVIAK